jgi:phage terminase small subunit
MGRRGPLPEPDKLRLLRGNPSKTPPRWQVKARPVAPTPPTWLDREARAEWRRVTPELERLGLLSHIDRGMLTLYCDA